MIAHTKDLYLVLLAAFGLMGLSGCSTHSSDDSKDAADRSQDEANAAGPDAGSADPSNLEDAAVAYDAGVDAKLDGPNPDAEADAASCPSCPAGRCSRDSTCIECSADLPCQNTSLKCDTVHHTCVACLPSADDCPTGRYCASNFACVRGCKDSASCSSGHCNASHECDRCLTDLECGAERVCGMFGCGAACTSAGDCSGGAPCCDGRCTDTQRDIAHCGGCGLACSESQFCGRKGCTGVALGKVCESAQGALVLSGLSGDAAESALLLSALESGCSPAPALSTVDQSQTNLLNPVTGQPVAGGNQLLVTLGSIYRNNLVSYIETNRIAPVYLVPLPGDEPAFEFRHSGSGQVLLHGTQAGENASHAHFLLQIVRDPPSGTLIVSAYGYWAEGTVAARSYLTHQVLPALSTYSDSWYIYEWTNANADPAPDAGDTYRLVGSGT